MSKNKHLFNQRPSVQKGLSLIEMMVALTLGLFVIAGILSIFSGTKQAYLYQEQTAKIQESGRFVMNFLSKYIRMAGYRNDPMTQEWTSVFPSYNFTDSGQKINFKAGQVIAGFDAVAKGNEIDSIIFRYRGGKDGVTDCLGNSPVQSKGDPNPALPAKQRVMINIFSLSDDDSDNGRSLSCRARIVGEDGTFLFSDPDQPLVSGIQAMQIQYGINDGQDSNRIIAQRYMTATQLNNKPSLWNFVVSVKIALLFRSEDKVVTQPQTYYFPPGSKGTQAKDYPLSLRRVFTMTINLNNLTRY
jgi:type IV pilus assembly protein PilW